MAASSLINKPFASLCNSKSELHPEIPFLRRVPFGVSSPCLQVNKKNTNFVVSSLQVNKKKTFSSISCQAVSIEQQPETEIEGLNIAEDVSQVCLCFYSWRFSVEFLHRLCFFSFENRVKVWTFHLWLNALSPLEGFTLLITRLCYECYLVISYLCVYYLPWSFSVQFLIGMVWYALKKRKEAGNCFPIV